MDIVERLLQPSSSTIVAVDMHTTGEPTRIIIEGYPEQSGTLLEQRAEALARYDHIRRKYSLEPRGHFDMYGAILRPETELTRSGEAHIGVLFTTNEGYSTMCGHATIALGRFLYDTNDKKCFPRRHEISPFMDEKGDLIAIIKLHAPCGLLLVTVPVSPETKRSDSKRPVSFVSVPSFVTGISVEIPIPASMKWPELRGRESITADFAYGGAFFCITTLQELGFEAGIETTNLDSTKIASSLLKAAIVNNFDLRDKFRHPEHEDLSFLYSILLVDNNMRPLKDTFPNENYHETGLLYFADGALDRSPTGSGVAARMALASAKNQIRDSEWRTYHSVVSVAAGWKGGFSAQIVNRTEQPFPTVQALICGNAYYTGVHRFIVEEDDFVGDDGFLLGKLKLP